MLSSPRPLEGPATLDLLGAFPPVLFRAVWGFFLGGVAASILSSSSSVGLERFFLEGPASGDLARTVVTIVSTQAGTKSEG